MAGADDGAAESEHGPISDDDAGLRQRIETETAGHLEGHLAEPKRQGRPEIAAKHEFVANSEEQRHVPGRGAVKQRRDQGPKRGLRQRHGPEHHRRAAAQEFNKQGDVMHWPGRGENYGNVYSLRMILAENRFPSPIGVEKIGIMRRQE